MSQFFETIKYQNGEFFLLDYHAERLNSTRFEKLGIESQLNLKAFLGDAPEDDVLYRCRVDYAEVISKVTFTPYTAALHKRVALKECGAYDYGYKYADRTFLISSLEETNADDVIFLKEGFLTDATYSNLAFFDGRQWYTPRTYLLNGVKRQSLINQGDLHLADIFVSSLHKFEKVAFINAMRDFELVYHFLLKNNEIQLTLEQ